MIMLRQSLLFGLSSLSPCWALEIAAAAPAVKECQICFNDHSEPAHLSTCHPNCESKNACKGCVVREFARQQANLNSNNPAFTLECPFCRVRNRIPTELLGDAFEAGRRGIADRWDNGPRLEQWEARHVTDLRFMIRLYFADGPYNNIDGPDPISTWDVSRVTDFNNAFENAPDWFTGKGLEHWNTSSATSMKDMFAKAESFNQDLGWWNTSSVKDMSGMFYNAKSFNQALRSWNTSSVKDMSFLFSGAELFNHYLGSWDTSSVETMSCLFDNAKSFNQYLGSWNTSSVVRMEGMFHRAKSFNQYLGSWNTSSVKDFSLMFIDASAFTGEGLETWDIKSLRDAKSIFKNAPHVTNRRVLEHFSRPSNSLT